MRRILVVFVLVALLAATAAAITKGELEVVCPLCGTKNRFVSWTSFGSYVYAWPSRFQLVFFPATDPDALWHCHECHFTTLSSDFAKWPEEQHEATRELLAGIPHTEHGKDYREVSLLERFLIAEQVYGLEERDDSFWCYFYRLQGFHLHKAKHQQAADAARQKTLEVALRMLTQEKNAGARKELLVITASMRHYLRDSAGALADLNAAAKLTFRHAALDDARNRNADAFLSELITDFITAIVEGRSTDDAEDFRLPEPRKRDPESPR